MPFYEIQHAYPMSVSQRDTLATSITEIHTRLFTTPSLFVHIQFQHLGPNTPTRASYNAGKACTANRILAHIRPGGSRSRDDLNVLCAKVKEAWDEVFEGDEVFDGGNRLHAVFVLGDIVAGMEAGLTLPEAGSDREWLRDNSELIWRRAEKGDTEMRELSVEMMEREDLKGML